MRSSKGSGHEMIKVVGRGIEPAGLYIAMNSKGIVLPNMMRERDRGHRSTGLNVLVSDEKNNAHGNNIAVNNKGGIINPNISHEERKKMEDVLGVELVPMTVAGYSTVGSACLAIELRIPRPLQGDR